MPSSSDRRHLGLQPLRTRRDRQLVSDDEEREQQQHDSDESTTPSGAASPSVATPAARKMTFAGDSVAAPALRLDSRRFSRGVLVHVRRRLCTRRRRLVVLRPIAGHPSRSAWVVRPDSDAFEIFANGAAIAVSIGRTSREKLGDDRPQRRRTRRAERFRRAAAI